MIRDLALTNKISGNTNYNVPCSYLYDQLTNHFSDHEDKSNEASCDEPNLCLSRRIICDFHMTIAVRFFNVGAGSGKNDDGTTIWNLTNMKEKGRENRKTKKKIRERSCVLCTLVGWTQSLLLELKVVTPTACCVKTSHFVYVAKCTFRQVSV